MLVTDDGDIEVVSTICARDDLVIGARSESERAKSAL